MKDFQTFPIRIPYTIFGNGCVSEVAQADKDFEAKKVLLVTGETIGKSELLKRVIKPLEEAGIKMAVFSGVEPDNPIENIVATARAAKENNCDMMIGVGGGSTMDNAKAAGCLAGCDDIDSIDITKWLGYNNVPQKGIPKIMVPTTSGTGSEWTMPLMVMKEGRKRAMVSPYLLPDAVVVDPLMALDMPQKVTADTGMDVLSHAIETYTGIRANPFSDMIAERAISLVGANLRRAYAKGAGDLESRYNMSFASMIACSQLTIAGAHLGHGMAHAVQSAMHNITHGITCSLVLCAVMEFNKIAKIEGIAKIAELMGENVEGLSMRERADLGIEAVKQLTIDIGMPQRLRDIGVNREDINKIVDILFEDMGRLIEQNPRQCSREDATGIYESIW